MRLPAKILAPLAGRPLLQLLVERTRRAPLDALWLATTTNASDDVTAAWGHAVGVEVHRGPEEDVLARFCGVLDREPAADTVVRLTADDPFVDAATIVAVVEALHRSPESVGVVSEDPSNRRRPLGFVPQAARATAIREVARSLDADGMPPTHPHRSHVLSRLYEIGAAGALVLSPSRAASWRWTVDTLRDYEMARAAFDQFGADALTIGYDAMVEILEANPTIPEMNLDVVQKDWRLG